MLLKSCNRRILRSNWKQSAFACWTMKTASKNILDQIYSNSINSSLSNHIRHLLNFNFLDTFKATINFCYSIDFILFSIRSLFHNDSFLSSPELLLRSLFIHPIFRALLYFNFFCRAWFNCFPYELTRNVFSRFPWSSSGLMLPIEYNF